MQPQQPPSTFTEALALIDQKPGPGMDMVAAVAIVNGVPPQEAHGATIDTIAQAGTVALFTFQMAAISSPTLKSEALTSDQLQRLLQAESPDKTMRTVSACMTQDQAEEWMRNAEELLECIKEGVDTVEEAAQITGTAKGAALLAIRKFKEKTTREGVKLNPATRVLLTRFEQIARAPS